MVLDLGPVDCGNLASQSTLSRFAKAVGPCELYRMGGTLADVVIERHRHRQGGKAHHITIDFDPTDAPTHAVHQLSFFDGHYGSWCDLPLMGSISFDKDPEKFLVAPSKSFIFNSACVPSVSD